MEPGEIGQSLQIRQPRIGKISAAYIEFRECGQAPQMRQPSIAKRGLKKVQRLHSIETPNLRNRCIGFGRGRLEPDAGDVAEIVNSHEVYIQAGWMRIKLPVDRHAWQRLLQVVNAGSGDPSTAETEVGEFGQSLRSTSPASLTCVLTDFEGDEIRQPLQMCHPGVVTLEFPRDSVP